MFLHGLLDKMKLRMYLAVLLLGITGSAVKANETREILNLAAPSHPATGDVLRENISSSGKLNDLTKFQNDQSNLNTTIRRFENVVDGVNIMMGDVSNYDVIFTENKFQSAKPELLPRVKQPEERSSLHVGTKEILRNHSPRIAAVKLQSPSTQGYFDASFTMRTWIPLDFMTCYSDENYEHIKFSSALDTGRGDRLPVGIEYYIYPVKKYTALSLLTAVMEQRYGAYQCDLNGAMKIVTLRQRNPMSGNVYALEAFKVANVGESVDLEVHFLRRESFFVKWRHNGVGISRWKNETKVKMRNVQLSNAGIYECVHSKGKSRRRGGEIPLALMRLIVRKCRANMYGDNCDQKCPPCYNGGVCHDQLGICVCPAGFTGTNCETACGRNLFGVDCSSKCYDGGVAGCRYQLFCKPDPYGCSCAPGFKGHNCGQGCEEGWYGADCKQPCHCAKGPQFCDVYTGACEGGCAGKWRGDSCQIKGK